MPNYLGQMTREQAAEIQRLRAQAMEDEFKRRQAAPPPPPPADPAPQVQSILVAGRQDESFLAFRSAADAMRWMDRQEAAREARTAADAAAGADGQNGSQDAVSGDPTRSEGEAKRLNEAAATVPGWVPSMGIDHAAHSEPAVDVPDWPDDA